MGRQHKESFGEEGGLVGGILGAAGQTQSVTDTSPPAPTCCERSLISEERDVCEHPAPPSPRLPQVLVTLYELTCPAPLPDGHSAVKALISSEQTRTLKLIHVMWGDVIVSCDHSSRKPPTCRSHVIDNAARRKH